MNLGLSSILTVLSCWQCIKLRSPSARAEGAGLFRLDGQSSRAEKLSFLGANAPLHTTAAAASLLGYTTTRQLSCYHRTGSFAFGRPARPQRPKSSVLASKGQIRPGRAALHRSGLFLARLAKSVAMSGSQLWSTNSLTKCRNNSDLRLNDTRF